MSKQDYIRQLGEVAFGSRLKRISDRVNKEVSNLFKSQNLDIEPSWLPLLIYLEDNGNASVTEIASAMNFTHPAVIHLLNKMENRKLILVFGDKDDRRKRLVKLSDYGRKILDSSSSLLEEIRLSVVDLFNSGGCNYLNVMDSLERSLEEKNLLLRIEERIKKRHIDSVDILKYSPQFKDNFKSLNIEWLEKYFAVEPEDERVLNNPEDIILKGGEIFFASIEGNVVGTCAMIKKNENEYELAKMAVTEKARGRQAGKKLALAAIGFAYSNGAASIVLETSQKLNAAVRLYEDLGFEYAEASEASKYKRTTMKMKMDLKNI